MTVSALIPSTPAQNKTKEKKKRAQRQDRQPRVKAKGGWRDNRKGEAADRLG